MFAHVAPPVRSAPVPFARSAAVVSRPLPVLKAFGGLAFLHPGSALKAKGITITNRLTLPCQRFVRSVPPAAHPACGLGAPSLTARSGSLDPALGSGTVSTTADLKFVRGQRSLAISSGQISASRGVVTVRVTIGGHSVSLGTVKPRVTRTVSDVTLDNSTLKLTSAGAGALGHALGTSLKAGGSIATFGGNVVFTQANVVSGSAEFSLPGQQTVTPTGAATGGGHALNLPVLPGVLPLSHDLGSLAGTLHLSGGATMTIGGAPVTLTDLSITLDGKQIDQARTDQLGATVNGHHVVLADMKESSGAASDNGTMETDDETTVSLTEAGASALGGSYKSGSKFGTGQIFATVGH
jgi:hypothetical protein